MQVFSNIEIQNSPSCVAVGCFDGIHIAHQKIIHEMCSYAVTHGLISAVFTFPTSPASIIGNTRPRTLISQNDKIDILENLGVEKCFSIDFLNIKNTTAEDYIKKILIGKLRAKAVFCGFNYRFGKNAQGSSDYLRETCKACGAEAFISEPVCLNGIVVSSSRIRSLIEQGEMSTANRLLGKPFSIVQTIVEGKHNGRTVGIPTINQNLPDEFVVPRFGVYASFVYIDGKRFKSITNIGTRPTVNGTEKNVETHILDDFQGELYGKSIRTELLHFIRDERKFSDLTELSKQIKCDIKYISNNEIYQKYL